MMLEIENIAILMFEKEHMVYKRLVIKLNIVDQLINLITQGWNYDLV